MSLPLDQGLGDLELSFDIVLRIIVDRNCGLLIVVVVTDENGLFEPVFSQTNLRVLVERKVLFGPRARIVEKVVSLGGPFATPSLAYSFKVLSLLARIRV